VARRRAPAIQELYKEQAVPALQREFAYANPMELPRLEKIVLNIGLGEARENARALDTASGDLATITGQKPVITRAKKSIANFRLREGMPIGVMVTLRGQRMFEFYDRLVNAALPRIRDFRGCSTKAFDGRGNYSLGVREQLRIRGMQINIITSARSDEEGKRLLELLGMPFARS
jgi:large subunit ribosomal protein L5